MRGLGTGTSDIGGLDGTRARGDDQGGGGGLALTRRAVRGGDGDEVGGSDGAVAAVVRSSGRRDDGLGSASRGLLVAILAAEGVVANASTQLGGADGMVRVDGRLAVDEGGDALARALVLEVSGDGRCGNGRASRGLAVVAVGEGVVADAEIQLESALVFAMVRRGLATVVLVQALLDTGVSRRSSCGGCGCGGGLARARRWLDVVSVGNDIVADAAAQLARASTGRKIRNLDAGIIPSEAFVKAVGGSGRRSGGGCGDGRVAGTPRWLDVVSVGGNIVADALAQLASAGAGREIGHLDAGIVPRETFFNASTRRRSGSWSGSCGGGGGCASGWERALPEVEADALGVGGHAVGLVGVGLDVAGFPVRVAFAGAGVHVGASDGDVGGRGGAKYGCGHEDDAGTHGGDDEVDTNV